MSTGKGGIATEGEAKSKLGSNVSVTSNKLCTKSRALQIGALEIGMQSLPSNKCVLYSQLIKSISGLQRTGMYWFIVLSKYWVDDPNILDSDFTNFLEVTMKVSGDYGTTTQKIFFSYGTLKANNSCLYTGTEFYWCTEYPLSGGTQSVSFLHETPDYSGIFGNGDPYARIEEITINDASTRGGIDYWSSDFKWKIMDVSSTSNIRIRSSSSPVDITSLNINVYNGLSDPPSDAYSKGYTLKATNNPKNIPMTASMHSDGYLNGKALVAWVSEN